MTIAERKLYQAARLQAERNKAIGFCSRAGLYMLFEALKAPEVIRAGG